MQAVWQYHGYSMKLTRFECWDATAVASQNVSNPRRHDGRTTVTTALICCLQPPNSPSQTHPGPSHLLLWVLLVLLVSFSLVPHLPRPDAMTIPQNFGKSKISMLRGEEAQGRANSKKSGASDLSFSIEVESTAGPLQPPSFNVLYVQTPRIGVLQTPVVQGLVQTWHETVDLIKPLMRFGFPETSLRTKCPYYK